MRVEYPILLALVCTFIIDIDFTLQLLAHRVPNQVLDNSTGDVVASHYWLYKQDLARLKGLGMPGMLLLYPGASVCKTVTSG